MTQALVNLVTNYGLLAVLVLMAAESCGLPFPSEVIMPVGGALAAAGHLNLGLVILAGAVGNLVGSAVAYWLAARFGTPLLLGPGRRVGFSEKHLAMADRWFDRYGLLAVFIGRVLPVIRTYISFPAGLAGVRRTPFALLTFVGALPWCAALALVGFELKSNYDTIAGPLSKAAIVIALVVAIGLVVWFLRVRASANQDTNSRIGVP